MRFWYDTHHGRAEFVKAADESIAYQIFDVIDAMVEDSGAALAELRVDGGPTRDAYLMQFESDLVGSPIRIASNDEMSGLGAAWACGIALGMYTRDVVDVYGARGIVEPSMPLTSEPKRSPAGAMPSRRRLRTSDALGRCYGALFVPIGEDANERVM